MQNESSNELHSGSSRFLSFSLGAEEFAVPLLIVREVIALPAITPVPQTPAHFLGIMNLRGQVISVMDLRLKLSIKPGAQMETSIIICDLQPNSIGIVVDSINSVLTAKKEEISERPEVQSQKSGEYIEGVYRAQNKLVLLLNIAKILNTGDQQALLRNQANASLKAAA